MSTVTGQELERWDAQEVQWDGARAWLTSSAIRFLDLTIALAVIVVLGWLFALIALVVRFGSPGPAIFRQPRVGRNGRVFTVYKFRTMVCGAERVVHAAYMRSNIGIGMHHAAFVGADTDGAATEDPDVDDAEAGRVYELVNQRITAVGHFLRRTSLDELPQLWNVVLGQMSLVGPRPVVVYEVACYPEWYHERFRVKPGLTGLWQISGRDRLSYEEMVNLDIEFAFRRSLGLYLAILAKTAPAVLLRRETV